LTFSIAWFLSVFSLYVALPLIELKIFVQYSTIYRAFGFCFKQSLQDSHFNIKNIYYCFGIWNNAVQDQLNFEIKHFNLTKRHHHLLPWPLLELTKNIFKVLLWQLPAVSKVAFKLIWLLLVVLRIYSHRCMPFSWPNMNKWLTLNLATIPWQVSRNTFLQNFVIISFHFPYKSILNFSVSTVVDMRKDQA